MCVLFYLYSMRMSSAHTKHRYRNARTLRKLLTDAMGELEIPEICQRIREARERAGVTQEEMARRLFLSLGAYAAYERRREPRLSRLRQIAQALGLPEDYFENPAPALPAEDDFADRLGRIERVLEELVARLEPDESEDRSASS